MEAHERTGLDAPIARALVKMAIVGAYQQIRLVPLTGGVSSDVFRADIPSGPICVKRALPKLKVAADWRAPVERNRWEVEWMRIAATIVPAAVPEILGEDRESGCFAMAYLPPERYPVWKALLRDGVVDRATAAAVGDALGRIHAATADRPDVAAVHGDQFRATGFNLTVTGLDPGTYDLAVFPWSNVTNAFAPPKVVRVTIE